MNMPRAKSIVVDWTHALLATAAIIVAWYFAVGNLNAAAMLQGAATTGGDGVPEVTVVETIIRQGGLFAVLLVVLFFYRRDYRQLTESRAEENAALRTMLVENTKAQSDTANALRENNVIVHQAKNVMQSYLPMRKADGTWHGPGGV